MKILLADDDPLAREILKTLLGDLNYQVLVANDGKEAWALFQDHAPRIVISDWVMPEMNGLELCQKIRTSNVPDYTIFILITSQVGKENHRIAMDIGVDDFLTKPIDREQIWMRLRVAERHLKYAFHIKELKEIIPICMYCKKIRDDKNYWESIEKYVSRYTGGDLSHGICPDCLHKLEGEIQKLKPAIQQRPGVTII